MLVQTWCLRHRTGEVTAITSKQEVCEFVEHAARVKINTKWAKQTMAAVRSWTQRLAWYHGYISKEDWPANDHAFLKHICVNSDQANNGLAVGVRDTVTSSRHVLEEEQMQQTYRFALRQLPKRQMLLHNVLGCQPHLADSGPPKPNELHGQPGRVHVSAPSLEVWRRAPV